MFKGKKPSLTRGLILTSAAVIMTMVPVKLVAEESAAEIEQRVAALLASMSIEIGRAHV